MRLHSLLSTALCALSLTAVAPAGISVYQASGDLYVFGDNDDDSLQVFSRYYLAYISIYDYDTDTWTQHYGVDKVWVNSGNGDDFVFVNDYYGAADICVVTGNGNDSVRNYTISTRITIDIDTGNGEDNVFSYSFYGASYGGLISIDTGNGKDEAEIRSTSDNLDVHLGNGTDTVLGYANSSDGVIDGGRSKDSCAGLSVIAGTLDVINCES